MNETPGDAPKPPAAPEPPPGGESEHRVLFEHEAHEPTNVDAMGLDKHRQVVGGSYRPSMLRQVSRFAIFIAVVGGLFFGAKLLADDLDKPPASNPDKAPWSASGTPQEPAPTFLRQ